MGSVRWPVKHRNRVYEGVLRKDCGAKCSSGWVIPTTSGLDEWEHRKGRRSRRLLTRFQGLREVKWCAESTPDTLSPAMEQETEDENEKDNHGRGGSCDCRNRNRSSRHDKYTVEQLD